MFNLRQPCALTQIAIAIGCCVVVSVCSPGTLKAAVVYEEKTETFDIGVRNGDQQAVWNGLSRWGPSASGGHALGTTTGRLKWAYKRTQSSRGCTIHDIKVTTQTDIVLPGWLYRARADAKTQTFWTCIEKTVRIHEQRHAEIWRETAHAIDDALRGLSDVMRCEAVESTVNTIANRIHEEGRARQKEFDATESKLAREQSCFTPAKTVQIEVKAPQEKPAAGEHAAHEPIPYPMPVGFREQSAAENPAEPLAFDLKSVPFGAYLGASGILGLLVMTYLLVVAGRASSRKARDAAAAAIDSAVRDYNAQTADRRSMHDRRSADRPGENLGRRASDFGRRPS